MGKLMNYLQKQLTTEFKQDAEDCIKIYNHLSETIGRVWESEWNMLVKTEFIGFYPYKRKYKLTKIGNIYLKGIQNQ